MEISNCLLPPSAKSGGRQGAYSLIVTASSRWAMSFIRRRISDSGRTSRQIQEGPIASLRTAKNTSFPFAIGPLPTGRAQTSTKELGFQLFAIRELRTYAVTGDWGAS
jgi:hypothetical protein